MNPLFYYVGFKKYVAYAITFFLKKAYFLSHVYS